MFRPSPAVAGTRRGVILLVVVSLLTLFAIVGLSFVLYAESEKNTSRIQREAGVHHRAEMEPELLLSIFLGQFVYDVPDDERGVWSAMRGHSLARLMYGWNPDTSNIIPFNGLGRVHTTTDRLGERPFMNPFAALPANLRDDYRFINYTYHPNDGFLRDPERLGPVGGPGWRVSATQPPGPFLTGINAPYTYPDANNMFLGVVGPVNIRSGFANPPDGVVLAQSFHRDWLFRADATAWPTGFDKGSLHPANPNWRTPWGKYLTLRPRPIDQKRNPADPNEPELFPYCEDEGGDVKNLIGMPGYYYFYRDPRGQIEPPKVCNNDSIWMDLGAPVMTTPDGKKYKALFAPFIMDLDGRLNLNVHGNVRARNATGQPVHVSDQGWGPWEVNLSRVFPQNSRWYDLFQGNPAVPGLWGRYGADGAPSRASALSPAGRTPRFFAQANFDAARWQAPNYVPLVAGQRVQPPVTTTPLLSCFPTIPPGYDNGYAPPGPGNLGLERWDHPLRYSYMQPNNFPLLTLDDLRFADSNLEAILRYSDTGSPALTSRLYSLVPNALADPSLRRLFTTRSFDVDRPGVSPYVYNLTGTIPPFSGQPNLPSANGTNPEGPFTWPALSSPPLTWRNPPMPPAFQPSDYRNDDWRNVTAALGRLNLNRPLPPYPHQGSGLTAPFGPPITTGAFRGVDVNGRFDVDYNAANPALSGRIYKQFVAAQEARQRFAQEIYERFLVAVGVPPVAIPNTPTPDELKVRRWLAQLSVNIVDLIDEDDISTPFLFYKQANPDDHHYPDSPASPGGPDTPELLAGQIQWPTHWVFGTELPRVLVNEVLAQMEDSTPGVRVEASVRVFVELHNPFPRTLPNTVYQPDSFPVPLHIPAAGQLPAIAPYQVMIAAHTQAQSVVRPQYQVGGDINVLGNPEVDPATGRPFQVRKATTPSDFAGRTLTIGGTQQPPFQYQPPGTYENINAPYVPAHDLETATQPQGCFLLGPPAAGSGSLLTRDPFAIANNGPIPRPTPHVLSSNMQYHHRFRVQPDERNHGLTVVLRRLANPHLPFDARRVIGTPPQFNPHYNPYITVDYVEKTQIRSTNNAATANASLGKLQPYAAYNPAVTPSPISQLADQPPTVPPIPNELRHTFGKQNVPAPQGQAYDWLVHFDRQLISPAELLHVSGYAPYRLTQRFLFPNATGQIVKYDHRAPWLDEGLPQGQSHRLYRVFEYLHTGDRSADVAHGGRVPGKININTLWDRRILSALCDAQPSNHFIDALHVQRRFFERMIDAQPPAANPVARTRGPGGAPSEEDQPFWGLSAGAYPPGDPQFPNGAGLNETFMRFFRPTTPSGTHPHIQYELPTKIFNHVTTRSNVFAVWLTVGFFEVTDDTARPVKLGAEMGRAENRHVRHRMFAILDRTNLSIASVGTTVPAITMLQARPIEVEVSGLNGFVPGTSLRWDIEPNSLVLVDLGSQQELVRVLSTRVDTSATPDRYYITAQFSKLHRPQALLSLPDTPGSAPVFLKPVQIERPVPNDPGLVDITVAGLSGVTNPGTPAANFIAGESDGVSWRIARDTPLLVDVGDNQELATVVPNVVGQPPVLTWNAATLTGKFRLRLVKPHGDDFVLSNTLLGNPGPQPRFNPRQNPFSGVVRYLSIIQ